MSTKSLYIVIGGLLLIIGYLLFMPTTPQVVAPEVVPEVPAAEEVVPEAVPEPVAAPVAEDVVTIEGLFLSLAEEKTDFQKSFYYLLLDDGTEVVRIDLRPLLGYQLQDPTGKLGVDRGQQVVITGAMDETGFVIASIKPAQ